MKIYLTQKTYARKPVGNKTLRDLEIYKRKFVQNKEIKEKFHFKHSLNAKPAPSIRGGETEVKQSYFRYVCDCGQGFFTVYISNSTHQ